MCLLKTGFFVCRKIYIKPEFDQRVKLNSVLELLDFSFMPVIVYIFTLSYSQSLE